MVHASRRSLRHAEKDRKPGTTSELGDAIATATIAVYRSHGVQSSQTVLASIVAVGDEIRVLSYGIGTKTPNGCGLRDCHAEVLARRAFLRFLYEGGKVNGQLFLYSSSMPCGNATIRRWAKTKKPPKDQIPHAPFFVFADGQIDLLCKGCDDESPNWYPKGMCRFGSCHSCSDKIARWVALGLQGALIPEMYRLDGIVVGRKFSFEHARRAFCCRIPNLDKHPLILGTAIKLDDGVYENESDGAKFHSECRAWWATADEPEKIDGTTGLLTHGDPSLLCKRALADAWLRTHSHEVQIPPGLTYADAKLRFASPEYRQRRATFFSVSPFREWQFSPREDFPFVESEECDPICP